MLPDDGTGADALRVGAFCGEAGVTVRIGPIEPVDARMGLAGRTGVGWSEEVAEEVESALRPEPIEAERSSMGEGENLVLFCKVVERLYHQLLRAILPSSQVTAYVAAPYYPDFSLVITWKKNIPHSTPDLAQRRHPQPIPHPSFTLPFLIILHVNLVQKVHTVHPPQAGPVLFPLLFLVQNQAVCLSRGFYTGQVYTPAGSFP